MRAGRSAASSLLLLLAGCGEPQDDRAAWLDAMSHPGEVERCGRIEDPDLAGECLTVAASVLARSGGPGEAEQLCEAIRHRVWSAECWFEIADARDLTGAEAHQLCGRAGPFREPCLAHAMAREAKVVFAGCRPGEELACEAALLERVRLYLGERRARARARELVAAHISARSAGETFARASCGQADDELCEHAFRARVSLASGGLPSGPAWREACEGGISRQEAEELGLPEWSEEVDDLVAAGFARLCGRPEATPSR